MRFFASGERLGLGPACLAPARGSSSCHSLPAPLHPRIRCTFPSNIPACLRRSRFAFGCAEGGAGPGGGREASFRFGTLVFGLCITVRVGYASRSGQHVSKHAPAWHFARVIRYCVPEPKRATVPLVSLLVLGTASRHCTHVPHPASHAVQCTWIRIRRSGYLVRCSPK